jgi:predicted HTH domain antitoxin
MNLVVDIPEKYLFNQSPETFKLILKLNTAIDMYRNGLLSSGAAAELVGSIDRYEFLYECKKRGIEPQTYENTEELDAEVTMLAKELL